jgi:hypothetical protein
MKVSFNKFWGALLLWMLLPTALLAQQGGYWVLDEMTYDSRNSYYFIRSYTNGTIIHQYARNVRSGNTIQVGGDSGLITAEEAQRYNHGFTENSVMVGTSHLSRLSWSTPPARVKEGEERKILMDASLELTENDINHNLQYSISLSRIDPRGFTSYPRPDMADTSVDAGESFVLSKDLTSVKGRAIWTKAHPLPASIAHPGHIRLELTISAGTSQPAIYYRYKFVPDLKEVNTIASSSPGEDRGGREDGDGSDGDFKIPWTFIAILAATVGTARLFLRNRKKKSEKDPEKKHNTYRMVLYKDFGDTLVLGEPARMVGARIEETTVQGVVRDRPDLTAMISIVAVSGCQAVNLRTEGRYRAVDVAADGTAQDHAQLRFIFNGPGGMYINNVFFYVQEAPVLIMAEALTFAAYQNQELDMEMGLNNYSGQRVLKMETSLADGQSRFFRAEIRQDAEVPGKFVVHVKELPTLAPDEKDDRAGDIEQYYCSVTIWLEGLIEPVRGGFDLYRMHLGLRVDLRALKAYLVTYDSDDRSEVLATSPKERKKFGESRIRLKLIVEDPETGEIKSVIPDKKPAIVYLDQQEGSLLFLDKYGNSVENLCAFLQFQYAFQGVEEDNTFWGYIHATKGGLIPPNRAKAKVLVAVSWHGTVYSRELVVPIISQPFENIIDNQEYAKWLRENDRQCDQLISLRSKISCDPAFAELMPFYYKVHAMVEGYDQRFGIYQPDYKAVMKVFDDYCSGKIGTYFANKSVWQPSWTEAEENFNAFIATWGEMQKKPVVIGLRIALGVFTGGTSELVFTPADAMVDMQEYVNQGGDSTFDGFVVASSKIVFWEGAFYLGGKLLNAIGRSKSGQAAASKLKESFKKLKNKFLGAKEIEDGTKKLAGSKGVNTAGLGNKVQEAGKKLDQIKRNSQARANDAIRKTRAKGDSVFKKQSLLAEEAAKRARKDAQKILDDFETVMNNPTASPDEMRRVTLALQGDKNAQNLLRNSPSDLLRANFNAQMKEIYKNTDPVAMKKMAQRLGVSDDCIRPWNGASGNDAKDLLYGRKIGADRDVTFQVKGPDGKWVDISEEVMEQAYAEAFTEVNLNLFPANRKECLKVLKKYDQAVVNGLTGLESYGDDLGRIINPGRQTEKLVDPQRVARTFEHKCKEFINQGKACKEQADQLFKAGFIEEALHIQGYGDALVEEGIRQNTKQFKRILDPRIQALAVKGHTKDYSLLYDKLNILESLGNPPPKGALPITLEEARVILQDQYGCTVEEVVKECAELIPEINQYL